MRRILIAIVVALLAATACTDTEQPADRADTSPAPAEETASSSSPTAEETTPALASCKNPEGFTIDYPSDWFTNPGDVVPPCSQFNPVPFEVPRGTDERVAAITAFVDPVPFERISEPRERRDADRQELTIDGRNAVRLEYEAGPNSIWPEGTPLTMYMTEAPDSEKGRAQTLIVDTIGLQIFDYERNQEILDNIAPALRWVPDA